MTAPWLRQRKTEEVTNEETISQDHEAKDTPLDRLRNLIADLSPFLDSQGRALCYVKSGGSGTQALTSLDGEVTFSILNYRYYSKHQAVPNRSEVSQALNLTRGELWDKRPAQGELDRRWSATITAIVKAVQSKGDFLGSARVAGALLREVCGRDTNLIGALPRTDDQLGIVLSRIGLLLRSHNIELFRPPRRDKERLWCWRLLTPGHDTSDTTVTHTSKASGSSDDGQNHEIPQNDASDTYADQLETLNQISQGVLN